jgi:hypothetical protein
VEERNAKIVETVMGMWRAGCPWADISQEIGMTRQRISQILLAAGIRLKAERQRIVQDEMARIIAAAQERGEYITATRTREQLHESGVRITPSRTHQELRKIGIVCSSHSGHPPMVGPQPDTLHCPCCGWQPISAFAAKIQQTRKNGHRCCKCQSDYYRQRRYGAMDDTTSYPAD